MNRVAPPQVDAAYAALPQAPDAAYAGHPVVPTAFEADEAEDQDGEASLPTTIHLDARIRCIMFMLGGAVLLPWNGMSSGIIDICTLTGTIVMITATPYFLSQLSEGLRATFSSYVSITFTISNFVFLAQATVTSKQVCRSHSSARELQLTPHAGIQHSSHSTYPGNSRRRGIRPIPNHPL
jgi:equilibrative nucleoside transporter 1/2/3